MLLKHYIVTFVIRLSASSLFKKQYYFSAMRSKEKNAYLPTILILLIIISFQAQSQQTLLSLLNENVEKADELFNNRLYPEALQIYLRLGKRNKASEDIYLKIGRTYYKTRGYRNAVRWYEKFVAENSLSAEDSYYFAESLSGTGDYDKAISRYKSYLEENPEDELVQQKIWRLANIEDLYEDSIHFSMQCLPINSAYTELGAVSHNTGIVFTSNRKAVHSVQRVDASVNDSFYRLYFSQLTSDSTTKQVLEYNDPVQFAPELRPKFHQGLLTFYENGNKMAYTVTGIEPSIVDERRNMHLYFAEKENGHWKTTEAFPYNSTEYSIGNPSLTKDGKILYFSSDMPGGYGGEDIYKSVFKDGRWTEPVNLGDRINTRGTESFPFIHAGHTLYFSSDGHAGLGGLDIFSVNIYEDNLGEVENMSFPMNTHYDDLSIFLNDEGTKGYFSSNRENDAGNDDIYEFEINRQAYPLEITGVLKYRDFTLADSSQLNVLADAEISVIDVFRQQIVSTTVSNASGRFSVIIPYFSQYKIQVVESNGDQSTVSFNIPKFGRSEIEPEIVVVKKALSNDGN